MKLNDLLRENKLSLSEKGRSCLVKAILDSSPMLLLAFEDYDIITDEQLISCFGALDLPEEELRKVIALFERYAKLWIFS